MLEGDGFVMLKSNNIGGNEHFSSVFYKYVEYMNNINVF